MLCQDWTAVYGAAVDCAKLHSVWAQYIPDSRRCSNFQQFCSSQRCSMGGAFAPLASRVAPLAVLSCLTEAPAQADAVNLLQDVGGQTQQGDGSAYGAAAGGAAAASQVAHPPIFWSCAVSQTQSCANNYLGQHFQGKTRQS